MRKKKEMMIQYNKEAILKAAKRLFEQKGIETTTMDDISREADYSKSTMYVYFSGKEDILNHIVLEQMSLLFEKLKECMAEEENFENCFYLICRKLIEFQEEYPVCYKLLLKKIQITEADIKEKNIFFQIYETGEKINELIENALSKGIEEGAIRADIQIIPTVFFLWSGISQIIQFADEKQEYFKLRLGMEREQYREYAFHLLFDSIRETGVNKK